ncbi:hypothetical protein A7P53_05990 [Acinetobacter defluvii]|uniref:hypothetical protein n=1 Tax=Acinetobacter defluvii TaxID=1871111 RepID=UPI00148FABF8|nr:hypothetical protein [Acinetobacter defluvii]NNP72017.1 hypothetical protein [Acinetobacter defluvii]
MSIEYFIFAMDDSCTKQNVLSIFAPHWKSLEKDHIFFEQSENYYLLDYGEDGDCHFDITLNDDQTVKGITIFRPCGSADMEQSVYKLISQFPMFMTYPTAPLLLVTANSECVQIITDENPELLEDLIIVDSFEDYLKT